MANPFVLLGAINGFLAVALGAFAAHGLKTHLGAAALEIFQTGVQYQMVHALALLLVGALRETVPYSPWLRPAGWCLVLGILLFSGSLYALALSDARGIGAITPVGGVLFLLGWLALGLAAARPGTRVARTKGKI